MRLKYRIFFENAICVLVLIALAGLACGPFLFGNQVPLAAQNILFEPPWEEARPHDLAPHAQGLAESHALRYYPWYAVLNESARHGALPLWNPYEGCGLPLLALWRSRCLSPFSIPFYFMPTPNRALEVSVLLKLIVAGLCAFYAARKFGFAPPLALLVGVAFEFSGPVFLWMAWPMADIVPWLPLWLVFAERLVLGQARYWPYGAIVVALMTLGGDPEALSAAILFAVLFMLARVVLARKRPRTAPASTCALVVAVALGLTLAGVQLAPYLEFLGQAASTGHAESTTDLGPGDLVLCFFPHFFGKGPGSMGAANAPRDLAVLRLLHVGLIQVLLLPLWISVRRFAAGLQRHRTEALILAAGLMTFVPLAAGDALLRLPLVGLLNPQALLLANGLALAFLAAAAAEEWLELDAEQCKAALLRLVIGLSILGLLAALAAWSARGLHRPLAPDFWIQAATAGGLALILFLILAWTLFRPSPRLMGYGLAGLSFVALYIAFAPGVPRTDEEVLFPETEFVAGLRAGNTRISGSAALARWPLASNQVPQVYCPSGVELKRHAGFIEQTEGDPKLLGRTGSRLLLLTKEDVQGPYASIRPRLKVMHVLSAGAVLFENTSAKPRAWMAYQGRPASRFEPAALSGDLSPLMEVATLPRPAPGVEAFVTFEPPERFDRVVVHVERTPPGVLVLADAWYPGWKATVDGIKADVFPVDGLFRGVAVGEGPHDIVFSYEPYSLTLGVLASVMAALIILAGLSYTVLARLRNHRRLRATPM